MTRDEAGLILERGEVPFPEGPRRGTSRQPLSGS
ncbi:unnamed protein product [Tetraodon nigroviridis]|uniref:(spotted green pufferfish) hypothetical protein n=1 Tax=Tetraodon nigroviridis TaxID=99883 RepID=Q4S2B2_TETNG|nr:unnamed protein product [Tetraodon nigroviridis]